MVILDSYGPLKSALPLSLADKTYDASDSKKSEEDLDEDLEPKLEPSGKSVSEPRTSQDAENGGLKPTPVEGKPKDKEAEEDEELHDFTIDGPKDFDHPASVGTQRVIWVPDDELGLGQAEVEDMRNRQIEASLDMTEMDGMGKIKITGPPPGGLPVNMG